MSTDKNPDDGIYLPRAVSVVEAANYVGCRSVKQFKREVRQGIWPGPITLNSRPQRWSIPQLEKALGGRDILRDFQAAAIARTRRKLDKKYGH